MGVVVSKRRPRSLLLIIPRPAASVPAQAGRRGAGGRASDRSRPAAAHDWEEGACDQAKEWGECPADRRSAAPVVPPSPRAPRGRFPVLGGAPTHTLTTWLSKVRKKS